jgi:hypothetical protein
LLYLYIFTHINALRGQKAKGFDAVPVVTYSSYWTSNSYLKTDNGCGVINNRAMIPICVLFQSAAGYVLSFTELKKLSGVSNIPQ